MRNPIPSSATRKAPAEKEVRIGLFGFISPYKGMTSAIETLQYLPDNFRLVVHGSIHPTAQMGFRECDDYLKQMLQRIKRKGLVRGVLFQPSPDDNSFAAAVQAADVVVCPYLEVHQSASGSAKIAIELGKPLICTRTQGFLALDEYYPGRVHLVDIGNYLQLAQMIETLADPAFCPSGPDDATNPVTFQFSAETLRDLYSRIMHT